jgi:hypothetical protein
MNAVGRLNVAHFINLNKGEQPFNLPYCQQIRRCEETERRLLHILQECKHMGVKINKPSEQRTFLESMDFLSKNKKKAVNMLFEEIEQEVTEKERFVTQQIDKLQEMTESFQTMVDYEQVLRSARTLLPAIRGGDAKQSMHGGLYVDEEYKSE